jgi:hemerythrin superfamily protein
MNGNTSILALMINDHCKIEDLVDNLEKKSKDDFDSMKKVFNNFEWELEKHIFIEEKAIFTSGYKMLPKLTNQHNYLLNILNNWRKDIQNKRMITNVYSFKEFLINHKNFEEEQVYPKLDEALPEEEKEHIVAKINQIVQK